ncbi:MAG TPA: DUF1080 domain-containing protein [Methylomirabilota bacterium]|nr:DUF1080 domain-containing protein [Methylomirabilota bacterium]
MKTLVVIALAASLVSSFGAAIPLSDGTTFKGWIGDTNKTWRIEDGAFVGGSLKQKVPRNEFLRTERQFTNFVLKVKFKLAGTNGFINGGVQIRSQPARNPPNEMVGYQCDVGEGWWGALYDETRRNKVLIKPDPEAVKKALKPGDWNEYLIRARGNRIQSAINGVNMIDYTEPDASIPQYGLVGLQVHGGGAAEASYKDITIQELP